MTEYANEAAGFFTGELYNNFSIRYKCNKQLLSSSELTDAVDTYTKLYNIYKTNAPQTEVKTIFGSDKSTCLNGACPHEDANLQIPTPNVMSYTSGAPNKLLVSNLDVYLDDCGARIREYDNTGANITKSYTNTRNYATNLRDVSYNALVNTRNNLDTQMNEILANNKNTILSEKQSELDASVYSTLLWTVMITSLIYYVFTKI